MTLGLRHSSRIHHTRCANKRSASILLGVVFCVSGYIALNVNPLLVTAGSISERFPSEDTYPSGTIVSIAQTVPTTVALADISSPDFLIGVVEDENSSLLAITRDFGDITVALSGEIEIFVSDINGDIKQGDFIGGSWIAGVGMSSLDGTEQKLIGVALETFNDETEDFVEVDDIETPFGKRTARIGKIALRLFDRQVGTDFAQNETTSLEKFAARVAGKQVLLARVIASVVLFIVSAIVSGVFLVNAIKGSFISLGRNPMASSSIYSNLAQVSGVSVGVILMGTVIAYAVLVI